MFEPAHRAIWAAIVGVPFDPFGLTPAQYSAFWDGVIAITLIVTLAAVFWQVDEARRARRERDRPWVIVHFEMKGLLAVLTVSNIGRTAARDVRVRFVSQPAFSSAVKGIDWLESPPFGRRLRMLAPGEEFHFHFDVLRFRKREGLPWTFDAEIEYTGMNGRPLAQGEDLLLDLRPYATGLLRADVDREIERIRKLIQGQPEGSRQDRTDLVYEIRKIRELMELDAQ